jgi:hypothetical protein
MSEEVPPYDSRMQRFNRTNISMHDFEHAVTFLDAAAHHDSTSPEFEALFMSAIVLYARPFSENERKGSPMSKARLHLDPETILGEQYGIHTHIIDCRNKAVAHAEWNYYPTSQIPVANVTGFATSSKRWHPVNEGVDPNELREMAIKMQKACLDELFQLTATTPGLG